MVTEKTEIPRVEDTLNHQDKLDPDERRRRLREIQLPQSRKIIKHPDFEIVWPEKVSSIGFLVLTLICGLILFLTWYAGKLLANL